MASVRAGKPALASTGDHIAVIRADQDLSQLTKDNLELVIAQAGAKNLNRGHLSDVDGWRSIGYQNVQYFVQVDATILQNNVPVSNLSGAQGSQRFFKITVPSGVPLLAIKTFGGSGDGDLYVRRALRPRFRSGTTGLTWAVTTRPLPSATSPQATGISCSRATTPTQGSRSSPFSSRPCRCRITCRSAICPARRAASRLPDHCASRVQPSDHPDLRRQW